MNRNQRRSPVLPWQLWLVISLLLNACQAGAAATAPPVATLPAGQPTVTTPPAPPTAVATTQGDQATQGIVLTLGSWRTDDVAPMNRILAQFHAAHPDIIIKFEPTGDYNAALDAQLAGGTAPDLLYLRSFNASRKLFAQGYLASLDDLPGLHENFTEAVRAAWATETGEAYGVPLMAVSHAIYYNVELFDQLNLTVPTTWEELLQVAKALKAAGITPFANTSQDAWPIAEIVFMGIAPNFIGGRAGRLAYLNGERCFNDAAMTSAFQAIREVAPYFPDYHELFNHADSMQIFLQGQAAMLFGGSWDITTFEATYPNRVWSVFAPPPPAGQPPQITFHLDAGMGVNAASLHPKEARIFLEWLTTPAFSAALGNELPGFFPLHTELPTLQNQHANAFLQLNNGRGADIRLAWEKLLDGAPDGYSLMQNGALAVLNGEQTPQQAADALQAGLAQWFEPAQHCQP